MLAHNRFFRPRLKSAGLLGDILPSWAAPGNVNHPLARAVQEVADQQLRSDALRDVRNMGITSVGVGAGAAGLAGLVRSIKRNLKKPKVTSGPTVLPVPFPAEEGDRKKSGLDESTKRDLFTAGATALAGGGTGALLGAVNAPRGYKREGAMRGAISGAPGGLAGFAFARGIKDLVSPAPGGSPYKGALMAAGGLTASDLLYGGGRSLPYMAMGRPSWEVRPDNLRESLLKHLKPSAIKKDEKEKEKSAGLSMKSGIPWYGPAMLFGGMAGLGVGWKGVDSLLKRRAKQQREQELDDARSSFHDALLSQYDKPLTAPKLGADQELSRALDQLFDQTEKVAATWDDMKGTALGMGGMYAGVTGLLTGALVYDKMKKRSRRAVLEKALQKRDRRRFTMSPTEIMAQPEPMMEAPEPTPAPPGAKLGRDFFAAAR